MDVPIFDTEYHRASRQNETRQLAVLSTNAPRIPWDTFAGKTLDWQHDEHFGLIGPTGLGKTTMLLNILPLHSYVVVFATKPRDRIMRTLIDQYDYYKIEHWRSIDPVRYPRRVLWPDASKLDSNTLQKRVFEDALERIYLEGYWTVAIDELWYMSNLLGMDAHFKTYLLQSRSLGISLVLSTQRPAWIPREVYTSCTHLMFWRTNDETDLKTLSGLGWRSARIIQSAVANLETYQCLYVNTRTGFMCRTRCPKVEISNLSKKERIIS